MEQEGQRWKLNALIYCHLAGQAKGNGTTSSADAM